MQHELQVKIMKELMSQLDEGRNVDAGVQYKAPTSVYTCKDIAKKEWDSFFQNHPQLIGMSGDLLEPDTFFTIDDFGTPILATRDREGKFRAFLNACRHRGVRVAHEARGKAVKFTCPFHAWTYASSGDLVAIPNNDHFGEVDKTCMGLVELPAVEKYGLLFVHPQPDGAIDVDALLGNFKSEIEDADYGRLQYLGETEIDMNLNWKLANDTFGETYHFQKLHKNTLGHLFYGDNLSYETDGNNHRFVFASKNIDTFREMPEEDWRLTEASTVLYFLFPNVQFNVAPGGDLFLIKIYPHPTEVGRSITKVGVYFSKETIAQAKVAEEEGRLAGAEDVLASGGDKKPPSLETVVELFSRIIQDEDYLMGETTQRAADNGLLKELIFGRNEPALHHYHNTFRKNLGMPPLEEV